MPQIGDGFVKLSKLHQRILFRSIRVTALFTTSSTSSVNLFVKFHGCLKFIHAETIHQLIWLFCYRVKEKSLFLLTTLIDNFFRLSHLIINDHILKILKHDIK